jgi:hypothetical protein
MPYNFSHTTWANYTLKVAHTEYVCLFFFDQPLFFRRSPKSAFFVGSGWRSNLFRRIVPALSSIFLLLFAFSSLASMSQTTLNVIQGSVPYLTYDDGLTKATNTDGLLSIKVGNQVISPQNNPSSPSDAIGLPAPNMSFAEIGMLVPPNVSSVALSTLIGPPYNYVRDDDGDSITAAGDLYLSIVDKNNNLVARNHVLSVCDAPYKLTLTSSGGYLNTRYGFPNHVRLDASSATYYINPHIDSSAVCFAKPNLQYGASSGGFNYYGPTSIWNPNKGFLIQSTDPAHYDRNFPTTGAHNLYFDLDVGGVGAYRLSWPSVTHSGITATMIPNSSTSVRVTLTGPHADSTQINSSSPGAIPRPSLPATFELVGLDRSGNAVIKYGFTLKQWFVNRGNVADYAPNQVPWCNSIGYLMPAVRDLTNAQCVGVAGGISAGDLCQGSVDAFFPSSGNHYQRRIGSGFFSEWGSMIDYTDANFFRDYYWTSEIVNGKQFVAHAVDGSIVNSFRYFNFRLVCASDLSP